MSSLSCAQVRVRCPPGDHRVRRMELVEYSSCNPRRPGARAVNARRQHDRGTKGALLAEAMCHLIEGMCAFGRCLATRHSPLLPEYLLLQCGTGREPHLPADRSRRPREAEGPSLTGTPGPKPNADVTDRTCRNDRIRDRIHVKESSARSSICGTHARSERIADVDRVEALLHKVSLRSH
ncbi:hypothetical protein BV20DRAFT_542284 [Pilatotrama ljubarskyi]|nr:hypothetical protein BV20DRAFT_542284 [Pilatotrama ljubarskyi]